MKRETTENNDKNKQEILTAWSVICTLHIHELKWIKCLSEGGGNSLLANFNKKCINHEKKHIEKNIYKIAYISFDFFEIDLMLLSPSQMRRRRFLQHNRPVEPFWTPLLFWMDVPPFCTDNADQLGDSVRTSCSCGCHGGLVEQLRWCTEVGHS